MRLSRAPVLLLGLVSACTVGPNFSPPKPPAATGYNDPSIRAGLSVTPLSDPAPQWWNGFKDPVLTLLIEKAVAGSPTLQEALLRVVEAHEQEVSAGAEGLPTLNGTGSYEREQLGTRGILESKGVYKAIDGLSAPTSPVNQFMPGLGNEIGTVGNGLLDQLEQPVNLYQYELTSSWELDLFGKVRRSVEEARASTAADVESTNDSLVMLESEVGENYFGLREAQMLAAQQTENIASAEQSFQLTSRLQKIGLDNDLDVEQARTQLLSEQAQMPNYEKQAQQAIDKLNVLTGQPPGTLDPLLDAAQPLPPPPATIGVGVPATLARRRPDIRESEDELHAATASVGVAVADFYPDITLMGSAGLRAVDVSYLTNWASLFYSAGPSISLPIFQGGKLSASLRMARAEQASAALDYRNTVLTALQEVEDGLVAYRTDQDAAVSTAASVQSAALALYLANNLNQNGLQSYLDVLDSERTLISARQQLIESKYNIDDDVVTLYTDLGGGWQGTAATIPQPVIPTAPPPLPAAADSLADTP